mmetsp:Transcript_36580/g.65872  ORF Transcript_36580/g.65872 Transcript_36580/m.65872 type:complete len:86 (+) Transcript_36580:685-942(+)
METCDRYYSKHQPLLFLWSSTVDNIYSSEDQRLKFNPQVDHDDEYGECLLLDSIWIRNNGLDHHRAKWSRCHTRFHSNVPSSSSS